MAHELPILRGRGSQVNPPNRFVASHVENDFAHLEHDEEFAEGLANRSTEYLVDSSKSIITRNDSPDVGFTHSINPYRGCEHGCAYCYARPTHEFLGFSAGLDFETKIMVKHDAPDLLRKELCAPKWVPQMLAISGVTDCYQPVERKLQITRKCLQVLAEFRNPVGMITKNHLITRDIDLLSELASHNAAVAILSITTLDSELARRMEPRTSAPARKLAAIETLARAGIPVGVMIAPIIPGLTDHEMPGILKAAAAAGAKFAGSVPVRLPLAVAPLFEQWLERHYPDRKDKVLNRIRSLRGGKLNDSNFHSRMNGQGVFADQIKSMFRLARRKAGLDTPFPTLSTASFKRPTAPGGQLTLFS
jgi:DNA repair photolyase